MGLGCWNRNFEKEFIKNYDLIKNELIKKDFKIYHEIKMENGKIDVIKDLRKEYSLWNFILAL